MAKKRTLEGPGIVLVPGIEPDALFLEYKARFEKMTGKELIDAFNREVGNRGWTSSRGSYLAALFNEFKERGYDFYEIGDDEYLSLARKVKLVGKKIKVIDKGERNG
jgi:hypothetical protein